MSRKNRLKRYKEVKEIEEKARQLGVIEALKEEVSALRYELDFVQNQKDEANKHADMLHNFYEKNIIDENGNPVSK